MQLQLVSTDNRDTCHVRRKVMLIDDQYGETRTGIRERGMAWYDNYLEESIPETLGVILLVSYPTV